MTAPEMLNQNYFELFGLNASYQVDQSLLKLKQQELQKNFHPDKFASATQQEQMLAMQISTHANSAYATIKDDLQRAVYLLKINGVDIGSETDTQMPMEFLMQQMEVREQLAEVKVNEEGLDQLELLLTNLNQQRIDIVNTLSNVFANNDLPQARELGRKFQFIYKLLAETRQKIAYIEDQLLN